MTTRYRAEIDGLRALSILGVLGFHADHDLLPGGFLGVDVFFVISGFLITSTLLQEHRINGRISLLDFWARRVRRLGPALIVVLCVVLVASFFLLERISGETGVLAKTAIATLLLNANHYFVFYSSNYFSQLAAHNPLLHMWSLSVEEQFYLVWPVTIAMALVAHKSGPLRLAIVLFSMSLWVSFHWSSSDASWAFFMMPSRAWELLAGAIAAIVFGAQCSWPRLLREAVATFGLLLVIGAFLLSSADGSSIALSALAPVAGTVLILAATNSPVRIFATALLDSRTVVYLGKISYPLYLWHWPVLVMTRSCRLYEPSLALDLIGLLVSVALAVLTHEFVEKKFWARTRNASSTRLLKIGAGAIAATLACWVGVGLWVRLGIGYSEMERRLDGSRDDRAETGCMFPLFPGEDSIAKCLPTSQEPSVLLWGDSHAEHWAPALSAAAGAKQIGFGVLAMNGCRPLLPPVGRPDCIRLNQYVLEHLQTWKNDRKLAGIVISARWAEGLGMESLSISDRETLGVNQYYDWRAVSQADALLKFEGALRSLADSVNAQGIRLLIIMPSPVQRYAAQHCLSLKDETECFVRLDEMRAFSRVAEEVILHVAAEVPGVRTIDPKEFLCADGRCPATIGGEIVYSDDDHLTRTFSRLSASQFEEEMQWLSQSR